jgi:hypothetical protein
LSDEAKGIFLINSMKGLSVPIVFNVERAVAIAVDDKIVPLTAVDSRHRSDLTSIQDGCSFRCPVSSFLAILCSGRT